PPIGPANRESFGCVPNRRRLLLSRSGPPNPHRPTHFRTGIEGKAPREPAKGVGCRNWDSGGWAWAVLPVADEVFGLISRFCGETIQGGRPFSENSRAQGGEKVANLQVDFVFAVHRCRDRFADEFAIAASKTVDRDLDGTRRLSQTLRKLG